MSDNDTHTPHRLKSLFSANTLAFSLFFQATVWNKRIYLETSNKRTVLCVLSTPSSWCLCNLHPFPWTCPSLFRLLSRVLNVHSCRRSPVRSDGSLNIVSSIHHNSSLLCLRGAATSDIISAADLKNYEIIACSQFQSSFSLLSCGGGCWGHRLLLHLTHPSAVRRSTGTCARSFAVLLLHSEPGPAASLGWKEPCRLGRGLDRGGQGGWQQMYCRLLPPTQPWTVLLCFLQTP